MGFIGERAAQGSPRNAAGFEGARRRSDRRNVRAAKPGVEALEGRLALSNALPPLISFSIDTTHIVPKLAPDLNLYQFFGTEEVVVPVTFKNKSGTLVWDPPPGTEAPPGPIKIPSSPAVGPVTITFDLSNVLDPDDEPLNPFAEVTVLGEPQTVNLNLAPGASHEYRFVVPIPDSLDVGQHYYLDAEVKTKIPMYLPDNPGENSEASTRTFEFVGTPKNNPTAFSNPNLYFKFIRDTLNGNFVALPRTVHSVTNEHVFIEGFESHYHEYTYVVTVNGQPTIGIGLDLLTGPPDVLMSLVNFVVSNVRNRLVTGPPSNPSRVLSWLESHPGVVAITSAQINSLFNQCVGDAEFDAAEAMGLDLITGEGRFQSLTPMQKISVVDLAYSDLPFFERAIFVAGAGDLPMAGFLLCDFAPSIGSARALRTEADFEELLYDARNKLGQVVSD
jgi:hypothetical protein